MLMPYCSDSLRKKEQRKMKELQFHIRLMEKKDLSAAMEIKNEEGWNQTLDDWQLLLYNQPGMCLVALHEDKVVATVSAIGYKDKLAWIGMMLVRKKYRGRGLSKMLMAGILQRLKYYPSIKLDATPAGLPVYANLGFVCEFDIYRMVRPPHKRQYQIKNPPKGSIPKTTLQEIVDLDERIYGVNRQNLLAYLYNQSPDMVGVIEEEGLVSGYIMSRPGTTHLQLGPLIARSTEASIALLSEALSKLDNRSVVIDVLEDKRDLLAWLLEQGFVQQRQLTRMYYHNNLYPGTISKQYLISGPELG